MDKSTPGPWRWLDAETLVGDHGHRPIVLTGDELCQRNSVGYLVEFDPKSPDARLIALSPEMEMMLRNVAISLDEIGETARLLKHPVLGESCGIPADAIRALLAKLEEK